LVLDPIIAALRPLGLRLLVAGGLFDTIGAVFYALDYWWRSCHGVWHLFVSAGSLTSSSGVPTSMAQPTAGL
jgi:hemolysin III